MERITWEGDSSLQKGYILGEALGHKAKIAVFSIKLSLNPAIAHSVTPYVLAHRLPFRGVERRFGSRAEAQKHAERYLVYAMELMGFIPKENGE